MQAKTERIPPPWYKGGTGAPVLDFSFFFPLKMQSFFSEIPFSTACYIIMLVFNYWYVGDGLRTVD